MAAKKKKVDVVKQREKRTKVAAVVGVVLLIAVGAYEIPSMLAVMNKKPPPGSTYDPGPTNGHSALPNVAGGSGASSSTNAAGQLVNSDAPPQTQNGQLVSFSVFETKNPFTPQVSSDQASSGSGSTPSTAAKQGAGTTPTSTTPAPTTTSTTATAQGGIVPPAATPPVVAPVGTTTTPTTTTTTTAAQPTIAISVNGVVSHVGTDGTFPTGAPVFRLVSWTKQSAQIGIVGGSYATGDPTLTLQVGSPVTLENQTDGKRYKIELLSTS
jgi:hypothetical protein